MSRIKQNRNYGELKEKLESYHLTTSLKSNIEILKDSILKGDNTVIYRDLANIESQRKFCLVFVDGMVNREVINENIINSIMNYKLPDTTLEITTFLQQQVLIVDDIKLSDNLDDIIGGLLYGDSVLFISGIAKAFIINTKGWETRGISEPQSETIIVGPREGFVESINTNMALIRRKINSPDLKFNSMEIGVRTKTKVSIAYVDGIANKDIINEVKRRLKTIEIEGLFSSHTIRELIQDNPLSAFKTIGDTERPDVVASKLLQGRIAIICDGSPSVLTLPYIFVESFQVNEDYYENYIFSSFNRLLRVAAFLITSLLPGAFVAISTFHKELFPTSLIISIFVSRENVPFSLAIEILAMLILFEILREAGLRLPKHIGSTVSIVGALILGDAAVSARFIGASTVIIVSLTGICGLILYEIRTSVLVLRFIFLVLGAFMGLYGIIFGVMGLTIYLVSMRSFDIPYMLNIVDINFRTIGDVVFRAPWSKLYRRSKYIASDPIRGKVANKGGSDE
ncbi:MAG: spore germination protein [Clostridium sp.]|uniref:spore germination protein n=1 Tax=Clostridium sp. TaxID=1506 RepID=UPI002FCC4CCD